ncbi:type III-B CRISPR-associated protein Cas10/Cmr2 [Dictyobacter arantiisoli]|uniref:Type III-B CRISPR-associated protein Cas10/Cmr2 n=1 Tax=Dictyobacter arantiisoli TaxID=2014874 RepID=A0A5A5TJC1_9CHLR|nr:type III-B CRISPR-associated protein Cas10/Cmr2 [Dictyobacter arantiisoli]GCF11710.1 type III-B CRISPR-associated protein Cas10/Cmr2 [Dictyobacter arantiisoli]
MSRYMLLFSLGPVQVFIAQTRKTRDLWISSLLLSKLMEAAMTNIPGQFVFPAQRTVGATPDIPNKYVALFPTLADAELAARQSQSQIAACWSYLCDAVYEDVVKPHGDNETKRIWQRQTAFETMFEIYWIVRERKPEQVYHEWLKDANTLFAARKRLRNFQSQDEPGIKSSISGQREILHTSASDQKSIKAFWLELAQNHSSMDINLDGTERLDSIDIIKRFVMKVSKTSTIPALSTPGAFAQPFPSTSSIATASFVESLLAGKIEASILQRWRIATPKPLSSKGEDATRDIPFLKHAADKNGELGWLLRRDGDLYFSEVFSPRRLKKDYQVNDLTTAEQLGHHGRGALRALLAAATAASLQSPTPYYAVIQMDGDRMGILLNGVTSQQEHESLSKALSEFAREIAGDLVEKNYPGRLVYAGGDDVLAFVPLSRDVAEAGQPLHVLELADHLQDRYHQKVVHALSEPRDERRVAGITASTGIVIAHHYTSLSYVLRAARLAESSAKHQYGRNALVVTIVRRSGEQTRVGCQWRYPELRAEGQPIALFSHFWRWFKEDRLSPTCVHLLLSESSTLVGLEQRAQQSEIARVLQRQFAEEVTPEVKKMLGQIADDLVRLAVAMDEANNGSEDDKRSWTVELHADQRRYGLVEVLGWLLVVAFLTRKEQE